ncbi:MAG: ATP-binding protein [Bacteroidales bacterium]|nr:ATP-binding protein [Bacteroidales bacterium]
MMEADGKPWPSATTSTPGSEKLECTVCRDLGWVRIDVPYGDPWFGKLVPCRDCELGRSLAQQASLVRTERWCTQLPEKNFVTFQSRGGAVDIALRAARAFAENPHRCLILWGSRGTGKTHLCAAVVNRLRERGVSAGFFTAPDLLDMLRSGYARGDYDELLNGLRNLDVLALDDLGVEKETDWATEKLFQIINHRYNKNLPLMISTNMNPELFEARLADRLCDNAWSLRIQLGAESWRRKTP